MFDWIVTHGLMWNEHAHTQKKTVHRDCAGGSQVGIWTGYGERDEDAQSLGKSQERAAH